MEPRGLLRLYVTDHTPLSQRAVGNLRDLQRNELAGQYALEVIDILTDPQAAEDAAIVATPTVIRLRPLPRRRLVGDLSDRAKVLRALDCSDAGDWFPEARS